MHRYVFGCAFDLVTDCRSLQFLFGRDNAKLSARLERWRLRLSPYRFSILHKPGGVHGETSPSDYLSRHPDAASNNEPDRKTIEFINFIVNSSTPVALNVEDIKNATDADPAL